jgi:dihydrofolate reductase
MTVTLIAAADLGRVIGLRNALPWRLPGDLKRFKAATMGKSLVMGRATYESLGRPLPGRTSIVLSRNPGFTAPGCLVARSLDAALELGAQTHPEVMVIGGAAIYAQALPRADRLLLTLVHARFEGDAWFPELAEGEWRMADQQAFPADASNPLATTLFDLRPARSHSSGARFAWPSPVGPGDLGGPLQSGSHPQF